MMRYDAAYIIIYPRSSPRVLFEIGVEFSFIFAASVGFTHGLAGDEGKVKKKRDSDIHVHMYMFCSSYGNRNKVW